MKIKNKIKQEKSTVVLPHVPQNKKGRRTPDLKVKTTSREQSMKIKNKIKHTLFKLNKNNVYLNMSFIFVKIQAAQM